MVTRSLLEARVKHKQNMITILESAGVVLSDGAVYWAIMDHGYEEVVYVIKTLKTKDTLDVESLELAWGIAKAMENEDKRFIEFLQANNCVLSTAALVYAMTANGQKFDEIYTVIKDLKKKGRWDKMHRHICGAYMYARRSDETLKNMLEKEGVTLCSGCFLYAYLLFPEEVHAIFEALKQKQDFDPDDRCFTRALVWSIQNKDKRMQEKLAKEGIKMNMSCLITAVEPVLYPSTFETVVQGIKANGKWNCNCDEALEALNIAIKRQDKYTYERLLAEGLQWKTRNLYVAVQRETVWGLKQVIKHMKSLKLLNSEDNEIKEAVQLAESLKDTRKFDLLLAENLVR